MINMLSMAATNVVWVSGAGSGMGRASAVELARAGRRIALSGRRMQALEETAALVREAGGDALVLPLDVGRDDASAAVDRIVQEWGRIDALVLAAGLNAPNRMWANQDIDEFERIIQTNTVGVARLVAAALPALRQAGGVVVVISSYSGWTYSPMAGVAYGASKTALGVLTRSINTQEAGSGVRACHLCPGDVDSDFLALRPNVPDAAARAAMLSPADVARAVKFVVDAPAHVRVDELVISPVSQV